MISKNDITVIDNVLSSHDADFIENRLLGSWFPWYLSQGVDFEDDNMFQFVHNFFKNNEWTTYEKDVVTPIIEKLNLISIIKIKANLTGLHQFNYTKNFHIDIESENSKTAIYYVNDNNGKTLFRDIGEVDCKKNRLVVFPSNIFHTGQMHSDTIHGGKCVINFNFYGS